MDTLTWEKPLHHGLKVERNLNFSTIANEEEEFGFSRKKTARDPMSHRIIEKRRRDRMNNCLADLSRLVPTNYLKKGRGRIEKTEIIEMAIKHLKHLQAHPCKDPNNCEVAKTTEQDHKRQYRQGYHECMSETVRFMVESEGLFSGDAVCVRLINHLQKHYDKVAGGMCYTQALGMMISEDSKSMNSNMEVDNHSNSCYPVSELYPTTPIPTPFASQNFETAKGLEINPAQESESPTRVTSQLREMLQNPGVPSQETKNTPSSVPVMVVVQPNGNVKQQEDGCYKFKNTIKHRFNADLRHYTSSPTDSHHSLQEVDDHNNNKILRPDDGSTGHAFFPYTTHTSLHPDSHHPHWDSHAETASSCGSNPSPPPKCSNGSSSGYSTNGENKSVVSPYPRTPDRLSNRSPSPLHPPQTGVPIFALHPKGSYYIPLTIELSLLIPYLVGLDDIAPVLHPISICVNLSSHSMKVEKPSGNFYQKPPSSYLMEKFQDRYIYPCPQSPTINNSA